MLHVIYPKRRKVDPIVDRVFSAFINVILWAMFAVGSFTVIYSLLKWIGAL